ncbi:MAG TPA: potassium channel family protein [Candidatus Dormibacteraeota bacterium]|nr:potassium channel family protein [Candidatus Dormibacteraeota bacterium]
MQPFAAVAGVVGALLVLYVLYDVFTAVVVPRPTNRRFLPSRLLIRTSWRVARAIGVRLPTVEKREQLLGVFAPSVLVGLLATWILGEIVGFALVVHALAFDFNHPPSLPDSVYVAGSALLTLGTGDLSAVGIPSRVVLVLTAATGLGTLALLISLLFSLYTHFQRREVLVVTLDARAGAPPSGVTLLENHGRLHMTDRLERTFEEWERWSAEVLDSHLAYPILAYFRSSHDNESWISALGAVLDAATLMVTTIEGLPKGEALMMVELGNHLVEDLAQQFRLSEEGEVGVERAEFEDARRRLGEAGFELTPTDAAWAKFSKIRMRYAYRLNTLAQYWATPPAQWIGDRTILKRHH